MLVQVAYRNDNVSIQFEFISARTDLEVGCFGFNGPLRQYFSLYRAVSQREGETGEKGEMRVKMSKQRHPHLRQVQ